MVAEDALCVKREVGQEAGVDFATLGEGVDLELAGLCPGRNERQEGGDVGVVGLLRLDRLGGEGGV